MNEVIKVKTDSEIFTIKMTEDSYGPTRLSWNKYHLNKVGKETSFDPEYSWENNKVEDFVEDD